MLSRFSSIRSQGASKSLIPLLQRITSVHTSTSLNQEDISKKEFPPATSKRDFVNFPRIIMRKERPPVRLGFIPQSWFDFFYPKTGYTGPYVFLVSVGTYLLSKEKVIFDGHLFEAISTVILYAILCKKLGPKVQSFFEKKMEEEGEILESMQNSKKDELLHNIKSLEGNDAVKKAIEEATIAKKEFVLLQMEMAFRERLALTHKTIKNRLDCLAELENAERRNTHKNLVDYVLRNVDKSLTPELEKNAMQNCIAELNALAAKA